MAVHDHGRDAPARTNISGDYTVDAARSRLGFAVRHAVVTRVRGRFETFSGTAHVDADRPDRSRVDLTVDAASLDSGWAQRDAHLRSHDFFGVEDHPTLAFSSTRVARDGDTWTITGGLTMKGVTRSVVLVLDETSVARDPSGRLRVGFAGSTTLDRSDWGLDFHVALETGGVLVGRQVTLELEVSALRAPD